MAIGNPTNNPQVWELFKQIIRGETPELSRKQVPVTSVEAEEEVLNLDNLRLNQTDTVQFVLKNTGENPLVITHVHASCGCTLPEWTKEPVSPGKTAIITVQVTPDTEGFFNKVITVSCNIEKRNIRLTLKGRVEA